MALNAQERRKIERAKTQKAQGRQWRPEGKQPNCRLPKTLRVMQDFFSKEGWSVIEQMGEKGPSEYVQPLGDHSWICRGMSQVVLSARAGVTRATVRRTIKRAIEIGFIRISELGLVGKRRTGTTYIIRAYEPTLADLRKNPKYFHTAEGHLVGRGRSPKLFLPGDAEEWKLNAMRPPAPRSAGPIKTGAKSGQRQRRDAIDIEMVVGALRKQETVDAGERAAKRLLAVSQKAYADFGCTDEIDAQVVAALIIQLGREEYKPNAAFPRPYSGWFARLLPSRVMKWAARNAPEPHARTG